MEVWAQLRSWILSFENSLESETKGYRLVRSRRLVVFLLQVYLVLAAGILAFASRFDFNFSEIKLYSLHSFLLIALCVRVPVMHFFNLNRGWWRYSSMADLVVIAKATFVGSAVISGLHLLGLTPFLPRSVILLDFIFNLLLLGGARMLFRLVHENGSSAAGRRSSDRRVLIVGAGDAGTALIQHLSKSEHMSAQVIGFVDDSVFKQKMQVYGVPVLGTTKDIPRLKQTHKINEVYIAIPTLKKAELSKITKICLDAKIVFKTIPSLKEIIEQGHNIGQLRPVRVEDLLGREPIELDKEVTSKELHNKVVLVTGAGGSIGSELCRQILKFAPKRLILLERSEYNLFQISGELQKKFPDLKIDPIVGDVCDAVGLDAIVYKTKPAIIYHAAAHKHVPLMEYSPREAVRNNVFGTRNIADMACKHGVKKFIMISTDKAVNPLNVMGYSKRLAELIVQSKAGNGTDFISVRFGNVLGSSGSAVEIFRKQIKEGGPVTVTHAEATRFFMTTPEAVELVLHAGTHGIGGEIYMLDMGQPVKIMELAQRMIELSDPESRREIDIEVTGLRPGEKVFEEIVWEGEEFSPADIEKVYRLKNKVCTKVLFERLQTFESRVELAACKVDVELKELVDFVDQGVRQKFSDQEKLRISAFAQGRGDRVPQVRQRG